MWGYPKRKDQEKKNLGTSKTSAPPRLGFLRHLHLVCSLSQPTATMTTFATFTLPALLEGWAAEKDFKPIGKISKDQATQRTIEPVGPHFLAHARRARHKRTFSEDDRIQAQERAKKVEENDDSDISEAEDPMLLARDAKDWKVCLPV